ncbi:MAG TPA: DNA methyltransferase [Anaerolineae bacterium]|nr:DNA methyltransferase [Anaerolineae bacterium]
MLWDDIRGVARQYGHPASFPIELAARHILLYTKAAESVIDIFLGAGTTIVAAEMLGRIGYGMELDPKYAAVTLERLLNLGLKPQRLMESKHPAR